LKFQVKKDDQLRVHPEGCGCKVRLGINNLDYKDLTPGLLQLRQISEFAPLRNLDSDFSGRRRFPVQCDYVLVVFGAKTGSDDFTCFSVMGVANFSDNYSVALGELLVV
jgi:hypothetical protein